jgi:hypothetical protein
VDETGTYDIPITYVLNALCKQHTKGFYHKKKKRAQLRLNTEALVPKDWKRVASTFTFFISACSTVPPHPALPAASEFRLILDSVPAKLRQFTGGLLW